MATKDEIKLQVQFERDAIAQGLKKLREQALRLEQSQYASATVYGVASIDTLLPLVVKEIERTNSRIYQRKNGQAFKEIAQYLSDVEPLAAAAITCKVTFDRVFARSKHGDTPNTLTNVTAAVGQALEDECQMRFYERECPGLLNYIKNKYWHKSAGTRQRMTVAQTMVNRYDAAKWDNWGQVNRVKLGTWLIDCLCRASGWFVPTKVRKGNKTPAILSPTPEFLAIKEQVISNSELFAAEAWPMLIEPNDWGCDGTPGGYLLNEVMRSHDMIRQVNGPLIQGGRAYDFLNKVQKVPYTLNTFVTGVAKTLYKRGYTVGKFIPLWHEDEPPKPPNIEEDEDARKAYRRLKAEWHNRQNDNAQRCVRTKRTMVAIDRHLKYDKFYLAWSYDYRGRAYPIPTVLTHQDTDFGKSLIKFYDQAPITESCEYWLAFQVATTYGLDKSTMNDRQQWVKDNIETITHVTTDPIGNLHLWEKVSEPWLFLAACEEYYHCCIKKDRKYTNLPVAVDATCSGVQILAGLAKDASAAKLVNVLPSDKPQDAYQVVADALKPRLPEHLQPMMNRKIVKRCVMTIPYNAKSLSNREYIREALKEEFDYDISPEDLTIIVSNLRGNKEEKISGVMQEILPGPMNVMSWIERQVGRKIKDGKTALEWESPSGFKVYQRFMVKDVERIKLQLMGQVKMNVVVGDKDEVDLAHHKNATSPNLIHSLDASLLHLATLKFDSPISLIHDSVLCRASNMRELSNLMRETYHDIFTDTNYLQTWADEIGATEPPPMVNTLRPSLVLQSDYFFC